MTALARQIETRMKANSKSILTLEREADLEDTLQRKSKMPSAEYLQEICDFLGCTIKDLLDFKNSLTSKSRQEKH